MKISLDEFRENANIGIEQHFLYKDRLLMMSSGCTGYILNEKGRIIGIEGAHWHLSEKRLLTDPVDPMPTQIFDTHDELIDNAKIDGKSFAEIWDDVFIGDCIVDETFYRSYKE